MKNLAYLFSMQCSKLRNLKDAATQIAQYRYIFQ